MKKKRIITGTVYVIVLIGLLAMKWLVPDGWGAIGFDALFTAVAIIGCLELLKAVKAVSKPQKAVAIAYCAMIVPLFALSEYTMDGGFISLAVLTLLGIIVQGIFYFANYEGSNGKSTLLSFFAMGYCGILTCLLSGINHVAGYSVAAVLLLFMIVMLTDCAAYVIGSIFKRWIPNKLAPKISPNKTVIGGIGGLIGGMAGAVAAYYIYYGLSLAIGSPQIALSGLHPALAFLLIGLIASVFGQAGDLFESAIKRKCNIKDTGKLLPGHGGVLDRFDSMLFSGVIILICFSFLIV